jgi:hypothetical protein
MIGKKNLASLVFESTVLINYLDSQSTRHLISLVGSGLKGDHLALTRGGKQLLHSNDAKSKETVIDSVVNLKQQLHCIGTELAAEHMTRVKISAGGDNRHCRSNDSQYEMLIPDGGVGVQLACSRVFLGWFVHLNHAIGLKSTCALIA